MTQTGYHQSQSSCVPGGCTTVIPPCQSQRVARPQPTAAIFANRSPPFARGGRVCSRDSSVVLTMTRAAYDETLKKKIKKKWRLSTVKSIALVCGNDSNVIELNWTELNWKGRNRFVSTCFVKLCFWHRPQASFPATLKNDVVSQRLEFGQSSGAVWESRWPSWAARLNEPSGFRGRKAILNHASALVSVGP